MASVTPTPHTDMPGASHLPPSDADSEKQHTASSLDITQRLEKKLAHLNASESILKRWLWEIVTWIVSFSCMAAIVVILIALNNREFKSREILGVAFAILSKIASAALLLPVSEAIGQLKWDWFNGKSSKEMWDFEIFDKASRGAWGSILLLFRTKGRSLAALGALLMVLLIANDTFFQQVITYYDRPHSVGVSYAPFVEKYIPDYPLPNKSGMELTIEDPDIRPPLYKFFFSNGSQPVPVGNGTHPELPISCPSNDCEFPEHNTLGVCSQCEDVSDMLQFDCRTGVADWAGNLTVNGEFPNRTMCGYFMNATLPDSVFMSGYSTSEDSPQGEALLVRILPLLTIMEKKPLWGGSIHFKDVQNVIQDAIIVTSRKDSASVYRNETPIAKECVLAWCVKTLKSSYKFNSYQEEVVKTFMSRKSGAKTPWSSYGIGDIVNSSTGTGAYTSYDEDIAIQPPEDEKTYGMTNLTHINVDSIFWNVFPSFITANYSSKPMLRFNTYRTGPAYLCEPKIIAWLPPNNLTHYFERMATAMTNAIRSSESRRLVQGAAYSIETFVRVQWAWLTFPFVLLILSLAFLVATILKTSKGKVDGPGVWKTSVMPTLIYGLPDDMQKQFNSSGTGTSIDDAKRLKIRLHPKKGWRVSGQPASPAPPIVVIQPNQPPPGWI